MSREHCRRYATYYKLDNDKSNRLALSSEMNGWYDAFTIAMPVRKICVKSVLLRLFISNRFETKLIVSALGAGYGRLISMHLKEGFAASDDRLEMQTSVHVENPKVFSECIEWKRKRWQEYFDIVFASEWQYSTILSVVQLMK